VRVRLPALALRAVSFASARRWAVSRGQRETASDADATALGNSTTPSLVLSVPSLQKGHYLMVASVNPPAVICHTPFAEEEGLGLQRIIPAWIISGVIHVVLLSGFLLVTYSVSAAPSDRQEFVEVAGLTEDDAWKEKNLINEEVGNDPDLPTNYDLSRLADVSVPGLVDPNGGVGLLNQSTDVPPTSVAPPPGFRSGQSGSPEADKPGMGNPIGSPGGHGGPRYVPGGSGGRSGGTRERMLREGGGNTISEACVARGLSWIIRHQANDGRWSLQEFANHGKCNCGQCVKLGDGRCNDVVATGLALLPLLGAGETHRAASKNNVYSKHVEKGLKFMLTKIGPDGQFGDGYTQAICTIVLCEAYGLTADPNLKPFAQRAINKVVDWQAPNGGFRYSPKENGDLSVSGWHIQALKSGQIHGLNVPRATIEGVNRFLDGLSSDDGSRYGYTGRDTNHRMTAVGLLCRQYLGWGPRTPGLTKGVEHLKQMKPVAVRDIYYYYYATQVMFHMGALQPEAWDAWNVPMRDFLIKTQDAGTTPDHRDQRGSWDPTGDIWEPYLGRLGYTSLCLLTLEVYYRTLPLYRREIGSAKAAPEKN
jgi:hypothetical protein